MPHARGGSPSFEIRRLVTADAIRPVEDLQRAVWGFDDIEVVPLHVLLTTARHGGLLLGAFEGDRLLGFSYGYRGLDLDGTPVLCSHLLAVAPAARGRGLGAALKWAQREAALADGLTRIVWTFDPLEHGNARLNLSRLGGATNRYIVDLYGELRDELNAGLPTDRLEVVWEVEAPRVRARVPSPSVAADGRPASADPSDEGDHGPLVDPDGPGGAVADPAGAARVRVRALSDAQALRRADPEAALAWRLHLRTTLRSLFGAGYLLFLAAKSARSALKADAPATAKIALPSPGAAYRRGLLLHLTNPKAIFFWGSLFAVIVSPDAARADIVTVGLACIATSTTVVFTYAFLFSTARAARAYLKLQQLFDGLFAALFGAAALSILTTRFA